MTCHQQGFGLRRWAFALGGILVAAGAPPAVAAEPASVTVELNKLEAQPKGCRAYFVIGNPSDTSWQALKLDLVFFRPDGVIDRRYALDLAPLQANRKIVRTFDLDAVPCDGIGSILANDVVECRDAAGPATGCLDRLSFSSRAAAALSK